MILYTVLPEEFVLAGLDVSGGGSLGPAAVWAGAPGSGAGLPATAEIWAQGLSGQVRLLLERGSDGGWRVSRLLSSDPADYLDPTFFPGRLLGDL